MLLILKLNTCGVPLVEYALCVQLMVVVVRAPPAGKMPSKRALVERGLNQLLVMSIAMNRLFYSSVTTQVYISVT